MKMTKKQAEEWMRAVDEDNIDDDDLEAAWLAIFKRAPDAQDRREGLWSHLCAAVSHETD
jgi:hypothetical protein